MRSILTDHARRYPGWALDDLYKLIHQAAMGSEHALKDGTAARALLIQELAHLDRGPDEPLIDPISPDGRIARVHLRPFAGLRLPVESLLVAFVQTARRVSPSTDRLSEYSEVAARLAEEGVLTFGGAEIAALVGERQSVGFPAVHHSRGYVELYRPAYRVVAREFLPDDIVKAARTGLNTGAVDNHGG